MDYFQEKEQKQSDATARLSLAYEDKRARIAALWKLDPATAMFKAEIMALCCCREPYISAGCIVHGIGTLIHAKSRSYNPGEKSR